MFTHPSLCLCQVAHPPKQCPQKKNIFFTVIITNVKSAVFHNEQVHRPSALRFVKDPVSVFPHAALQQVFARASGSSQAAPTTAQLGKVDRFAVCLAPVALETTPFFGLRLYW